MTPNPLAPRFGRAGGASTQQVREFGDITVSSVSYTANTSGIILGDCSAVTGNTESYYLIWGYVCGHSASSGAFGYIEDTEVGGPGDYRENITPYSVTSAGPMFQTFGLPIKLEPGTGVRYRPLNDPDGTVLLAVHYTIENR